MNLYRNLEDLPEFKNPVITIGSFDGLHLGHQEILDKLKQKAAEIDGETCVITFHPHPRQVIYPKDNSLQLLSTVQEKIDLFESFGVDNLIIVNFSIEFSQLSADEYIQKFLIGNFRPSYIIIGYDHRFGLNRRGNIDYLKWFETKGNFKVIEISKQEVNEIAISSTKIRSAILDRKIREANQLLGHPYTIAGKVIRGEQIGKTLGYPTANIQIKNDAKLIPPYGIYAAHAKLDSKKYECMLYIGDRPTMKDLTERTIEANIFDFDMDIYEDTLSIEILDFIREDIRFENLDQLKNQLRLDKIKCLEVLSNHSLISNKDDE